MAQLSHQGFLAAAHATQTPTYIFSRRFVRDVLYELAPADVLQRQHDRAAELVGGAAGEPTPELIEHVLRGSDNARAIALYERFGFEREGVMRGYAWRDGEHVDAISMARLRP